MCLGPGDTESLGPVCSDVPSPLCIQIYETVHFLPGFSWFESGFVFCNPNRGSALVSIWLLTKGRQERRHVRGQGSALPGGAW